MLDMRSGIIQIEIPFDMNWQQVGECEYLNVFLFLLDPFYQENNSLSVSVLC